MTDTKDSVPVIAPSNLPPNFRWVMYLWLLVLTVKVYDLDTGWYFAIGTFGLLLAIGTLGAIHKARFIDLFEVLRNDKPNP